MSSADAAVGMMDGAYFVGRKELLDFFNNLLDLSLKKIEETAPGAIACQVTELIFPASIPMARVNWEARSDFEFVQNYKLLQVAFTKHRVQRHVDVDKLIRAKYQDNLEFCQWLKAFYDQAAAPLEEDYDPAAVRAKGKGGKKFNQLHGSGKGRKGYTTASSAPDRNSRPLRERATQNSAATTTTKKSPLRPATTSGGSSKPADAELQKKNAELTEKVEELEANMEELERERDQIIMDVEKERDFYFGKLRSIEVLLQVHQEAAEAEGGSETTTPQDDMASVVERVFQILYASAEDNLTVNAEGQVVQATEDDEQEQQAAGEELDELLVDQEE